MSSCTLLMMMEIVPSPFSTTAKLFSVVCQFARQGDGKPVIRLGLDPLELSDDALVFHRDDGFKLLFLNLAGNLLDDGLTFRIGAEDLFRHILHVDDAFFLDRLAHRALDHRGQHRRIHLHGAASAIACATACTASLVDFVSAIAKSA